MSEGGGKPTYEIPRGTSVQERWEADGRYYVVTSNRVGQWERDEVAVDSAEVTGEEVDEMAEAIP
jgi:hypothetical protein